MFKSNTNASSYCTMRFSFARSAIQAKTGTEKKKTRKKGKDKKRANRATLSLGSANDNTPTAVVVTPQPGARPPCNLRSFISACIFPLGAFFKRRRCIARCWNQTALLVIVLFLLLQCNSNAQQSACAATQGTCESAISTMVCASLLSSPPTCEVFFSSLPTSTGLSSFFITVEIAHSDFSNEGEYISAVILGGQTPGRDYLKVDGAVNQCNNLSKILDLKVPMDTVSSAGELMSAHQSCVDLGGDWSNTEGKYARVNSLCDKTGKYSTVHQSTIKLTCGGSRETGTGLWAPASCSGGCTRSAGVTSGNISDSSGDYANNANCWWLMETSQGDEIRISFPSFSTESGYDEVRIYQ